jgi:methionyl-tRNA synthetase
MGYVEEKMNEFRIDLSMDYAWEKIAELDRDIQEKKPWESKDKEVIKNLVFSLYKIGCLLRPFMPKIAETIIEATKNNRKPENLFPRIS